MKEKVKEKQNVYASLCDSTSDEEKEVREARYKVTKKLAKKAATIAKNNARERLYQKLETKEGKKEVFKLARVREKKIRDLRNVRCIRGEDDKILVEETKIRER